MPIHDWTRVSAGTWHAFHLSWISEIQLTLNDGRMPPDYDAQAEPIVGPLGPDVLTLQTQNESDRDGESWGSNSSESQAVAVAVAPPRPRLIAATEMDHYVLKRRTIVVRHNSDDRIIAMIELVSPGNKESRHAIRSFVEKAAEAINRGYHLLIIDLFPPTSRDPNGIHNAIWSEFADQFYEAPEDARLTLVAYSSGQPKRAYLEPTAIGRELIDMPLFLESELYINVPLEQTYLSAYRGVAAKWRRVLEAQ